jgi:hypothetical protein
MGVPPARPGALALVVFGGWPGGVTAVEEVRDLGADGARADRRRPPAGLGGDGAGGGLVAGVASEHGE